ncbi:MAG: EAL domain-containing protein, partial [Geminicoccaceae bacterium]
IQDIQRWRDNSLVVPRIAINIHQDQISDINHLQWLERCYSEAAVDPGSLTFEITEGCVLGRGSEHVPKLLQQWRDRGYGVSLDDFGTGFASLSHLKNLPVSEFKIDRSFVNDLLDDPADRAIVDGLIKLAKELGTILIAEGVETLEQAIQLRSMGSCYAQGYLFAHPLPPAETDQLIHRGGVAVDQSRQTQAA